MERTTPRVVFDMSLAAIAAALLSAWTPHVMAQAPQAMLVDIALVNDESGSMKYNDPSEMRKDASQFPLDLSISGDRLSIVGFGNGGRIICPLTDAVAGRGDLLRAIGSVASAGKYSMVQEGLQNALNILEQRIPPHPSAVILLSDGEYDSDDFPPGTDLVSYFGELDKLASRFGEIRIPIYAVAFTKQANIERLCRISRLSGGACFKAETPSDIQTAFFAILQNLRPLWARTETTELVEGEEREFKQAVANGAEKLMVTVFKESIEDPQPTVTCIDPNGQAAPGDIQATRSYLASTVANPAPGIWTVKVKGRGKVTIAVITVLSVDIEILIPASGKIQKRSEDPLSLVVKLVSREPSISYESFAVDATLVGPNGAIEELKLRDDGATPDDAKNDGVFKGTSSVSGVPGPYSLLVRGYPKDNPQTVREVKRDFEVEIASARATVSMKDMVPHIMWLQPAEIAVALEPQSAFLGEVSFRVTRPDGSIVDLTLSASGGNTLAGTYPRTDLVGNYVVEILPSSGYEIAKGRAAFDVSYPPVQVAATDPGRVKPGDSKDIKVTVSCEQLYHEKTYKVTVEPAPDIRDCIEISPPVTSLVLVPTNLRASSTLTVTLKAVRKLPWSRASDISVKVDDPAETTVRLQGTRPAWFTILIAAGIVIAAIFVGWLIYLLKFSPRFPESAYIVELGETGLEVGRYDLRAHQKPWTRKIVVPDDLGPPSLPPGTMILRPRAGHVELLPLTDNLIVAGNPLSTGSIHRLEYAEVIAIGNVRLKYTKED